jgi:hypothetical protein
VEGWREPVKAALSIAAEIYPEARDLLLEEIDLDSKNNWLITVSFSVPRTVGANPLVSSLGGLTSRKLFKQFLINGNTNQVIAMKIRNVGDELH